MSEHTDAPVSPTPVAPREARLTERSPRLTLAGGSGRDEAEFDALAELFLGDEPETQARTGSATAGPAPQSVGRANAAKDAPPIEGLILGHLPVSASSWVKTYAAMRARALGGPVGLIRLMGGSLAIELVGVDSRGDMGARTVEQALEALRRRAVGVVARVDEIDEPDLARGAVDGMVVLSGGDEAAVVGAFRTIKAMASREGSGLDETPIRVAIVGHDAAGAREAFDRLSRSAMHSLSREIGFAGSVERLASEPSASLYHGEWSGSIRELLDCVAGRRAKLDPEAAVAESGEGEIKGDGRPSAASAESEELRDLPADPVPAVGAESEPSAQGSSVVGLIPGLSPVKIRCPDASHVEMAIDGGGELSVVVDPGEVGSGDGVLGWARKHESLIRSADASVRSIASRLIIVARDMRRARPLLDSRHRVYLLVETGDGASGTRVCVPLN